MQSVSDSEKQDGIIPALNIPYLPPVLVFPNTPQCSKWIDENLMHPTNRHSETYPIMQCILSRQILLHRQLRSSVSNMAINDPENISCKIGRRYEYIPCNYIFDHQKSLTYAQTMAQKYDLHYQAWKNEYDNLENEKFVSYEEFKRQSELLTPSPSVTNNTTAASFKNVKFIFKESRCDLESGQQTNFSEKVHHEANILNSSLNRKFGSDFDVDDMTSSLMRQAQAMDDEVEIRLLYLDDLNVVAYFKLTFILLLLGCDFKMYLLLMFVFLMDITGFLAFISKTLTRLSNSQPLEQSLRLLQYNGNRVAQHEMQSERSPLPSNIEDASNENILDDVEMTSSVNFTPNDEASNLNDLNLTTNNEIRKRIILHSTSSANETSEGISDNQTFSSQIPSSDPASHTPVHSTNGSTSMFPSTDKKCATFNSDQQSAANSQPTYIQRFLYQLVVMFFMTLLPSWNPDPAYLA